MYKVTDLLNNGYSTIWILIISFFAIISAILVISNKNPVVSILFLIGLFMGISSYLFIYGFNFIGLSYLLVYVGAVSILFLFILMLINIRVSELIANTNNNIPLAIITILAFFIPISNILPSPYKKSTFSLSELSINNKEKDIFYVSSNNWDNNILDISDITSIGNIMYTSHLLWLIITSIILLLAMVGSIVITINQKD